MLRIGSKFKIFDNSGIITVKIISDYSKTCTPSDIILSAVSSFRSGFRFSKKYLCLIAASRKLVKRKSGHYICADFGSGFLLKDRLTFYATKYSGPVFQECLLLKISNIIYLRRFV